MTQRFTLHLSIAAAFLSFGCTPTNAPLEKPPAIAAPAKHAPPPAPPALPDREPPPPSGDTKAFRFPRAQSGALPNGLKIVTIESTASPLVELRMVVLGGRAAEGARPGLAMLTAEMLKEGGAGGMKNHELVARIESLGAALTLDTASDRTTIAITTTKDQVEEALRLMAAVVERPMFAAADFAKVKKRAMDQSDERARASGTWAISMVLYRDLFDLPAEQHPYASWDATSVELSAITLADCRGYHTRMFVPTNTVLAVAGGVKHAAVMAAAQKSFHNARAAAPPAISFTDPVPPESLKITVVDRPQSQESELVIGMLGPSHLDDDFPAFAVASAVLGHGLAKAYPAHTHLVELAHGPSLLTAYARVKTESTGPFVKALFDHLKRLQQTAPGDEDVLAASRLLVDGFATRMSTVQNLAGELVRLRVLRLPDDHPDSHRKRLLDVTPALIAKTAGEHVRSDHAILVVAGDAGVIAPSLRRFGQVKVVDPAKGFARIRTIPMDATAPPGQN